MLSSQVKADSNGITQEQGREGAMLSSQVKAGSNGIIREQGRQDWYRLRPQLAVMLSSKSKVRRNGMF